MKTLIIIAMLAIAGTTALAGQRANIYLYRKPALMSWNQTHKLEIDGRLLARLSPASYVVRQVEPGQHFVVITGNIPIKVLSLEAGRTYFFKADFSGLKWDEVSEQQGRADVSKLKRVADLLD
jgi:hypothetical protein